ncbi:MAG: type II secretion system protein [Eubacteriales bacterium]|nr:type II secretion system protein [Eubacteriales bacterium]
MKRHNQKRGFTVVELVVIIAVVAILAAVLIPTYVHLVKKSNEANAQVEAKNLISEMLTDIILGDKDSADLLVFSKKGDDVYLHGYSAEQQRFLSYRNNPIALTTDMETTVQAAVGKLLAEDVIKQNEAVKSDNPNDWRLEKNVKTIIETLSTKYDVFVYANYIIDANLFAPHVHTWETAWAFDETYHWHKCVGCDEITGKAEHVYDADGKCVCGAVKTTHEHEHKFENKNVADKYLKSAADCTHSAVYYFSCACGEVGTQTFEYGTALGHSFGNGKVESASTCTIQGRMTYTCTRCGMTKTEAIPALGHTYGPNGKCIRCGATKPGQGGHTHKYSEVQKKAATCTMPAEYQLVCSCGEVGSQPYTKGAALGHAWDAGKVTTPATCKDTGVKTFTCTRCKTTKTEAVPTLAHTPVVVAGKEATCTETGLTEGKKCSVCGKVIVAQEIIPAKGHTPLEGPMGYVAGKEATCTELGLTASRKCAYCNELIEKQEVIPALGHDKAPYGASFSATCDREGNEAGEWCRRCQTIFVQPKTTPKLGHNMVKNEGEEDSPATCMAEGWVAGAHCTRCNKMRDSGLTVTVGAGTTVVDSNGTALIPEAICEGKANLHYFIPGNEGHNFGDDGKCRSCYKTKEELGLA